MLSLSIPQTATNIAPFLPITEWIHAKHLPVRGHHLDVLTAVCAFLDIINTHRNIILNCCLFFIFPILERQVLSFLEQDLQRTLCPGSFHVHQLGREFPVGPGSNDMGKWTGHAQSFL